MLVSLLAHWHIKMRSWHVFGMLAHAHVDHADTRSGKLPHALGKYKCDYENCN